MSFTAKVTESELQHVSLMSSSSEPERWLQYPLPHQYNEIIDILFQRWTENVLKGSSKRVANTVPSFILYDGGAEEPFTDVVTSPRLGDTMAVSIRQAKMLLRKDMKTKLAAIPDRIKAVQSQIVTRKVLALPVFQASQRVSVYLSMKSEISTDALVQHILNTNKACFIPRYDGIGMSMVRLASWQDYEGLPETKWKIKQPPVEEQREDALDTGGLDVILTPGVAFTSEGVRCGHGKGYYDNYLHQCEQRGHKPVTVALAFQEQICADIPTSEADRNIDYVIYPTDEEIQDALKDVT